MAFIDAVIRSLSSSIHHRNHHQREHLWKKNICSSAMAAFFHISHHFHRDAVWSLRKRTEKIVSYLNYLIDRPTVQPTSSQQDNYSSHQFETLFTPNAHQNYDKFHFELISVLHFSLVWIYIFLLSFNRNAQLRCTHASACTLCSNDVCRLSWETQRASIIISVVAGCI